MEIFGIEVEDLGEGLIPIEFVCMIKAIRSDGETGPSGSTLHLRASKGLCSWEATGMLRHGMLWIGDDWLDESHDGD